VTKSGPFTLRQCAGYRRVSAAIRGFVATIVELDDAEARDLPHKENLLVRVFRVGQLASEVVAAQDAELARRIVRARDDLSPDTDSATRARAKARRKKLARQLRNRGQSVLGHDEYFRVYVVELDASELDDPGRGYVYVGETGQSVDDRFEQHRLGTVEWSKARGSRRVGARAVRLRPDLTDTRIDRSRNASRAAERRLAERLRDAGYVVVGGR